MQNNEQKEGQGCRPGHDDKDTQKVPTKPTKWKQASTVQDSRLFVEDWHRQHSPQSTAQMNYAKK